jgi:hypothetical protein
MYTLDTNSARKADQSGRFINEVGKYIGKFTRAEDITAKTGTKGVAFTFDAQGQIANLSIYTLKANGDKIMGYDALMAIMTCLSCRTLTQTAGKVTKWDNDAGRETTVDSIIFPEIMNKPIGLLLESEDYEKNNGEIGTRMVIASVFQADTELTATEILDKKVNPEALAKRVLRLKHRPLKGSVKAVAKTGGSIADMDDDIPFK